MKIPEDEIVAELSASGVPIEDYFIIGYDICSVNENGGFSLLLIEDLPGEEDGEMHFAVVDYLRRVGAKEYQTYEQYYKQTGRKRP